VIAAVGLVLVVGAVLRFHDLGGDSLDADEAASWIQAKDGLLDLIRRTAHDNYPPLHNLALYAVMKLVGDSEWSLRLPSVIFGVANIGAVYWLATLTVGRTAGLIGAALLAISPFHFFYSQEARPYSLLAVAATVYAGTCFHYLRAPSVQRGAWVALAGLLLVYRDCRRLHRLCVPLHCSAPTDGIYLEGIECRGRCRVRAMVADTRIPCLCNRD